MEQLNRLDRYESAVVALRTTLANDCSRPSSSDALTGLVAFEVDPKIVANQLTHIELVLLSL